VIRYSISKRKMSKLVTKMNFDPRFEHLQRFSLGRTLRFQLALVLLFLSTLIKWTRSVLKFEMLRRFQQKLHEWYRSQIALAQQLPPPTHFDVVTVKVTTPVPEDNVYLDGNLYIPADGLSCKEKFPAVLIRTPYDKDNSFLGSRMAHIFAERGYACLVQDTRGRFGSGGDFFPIAHEVKDGTQTVRWLRQQPWSNGKVGTYGVSYLGLTAYAASGGGEPVDACVPIMASARLYPILFHGGHSFAFDLVIRWIWLVINVMQEKSVWNKVKKLFRSQMHLESALHPASDIPIHHRDFDVVGKELHFYREVYNAHELGHDFWTNKDILCDLSKKESSPPLAIVAGWHDIFVAQTFKDFEVASKVKTTKPLSLVCGPWSHWDILGYGRVGYSVGLELFDQQLKGESNKQLLNFDLENGFENRPTQVTVQVLHSETSAHPRGKWLAFHVWPPLEHTKPTNFYLGSGSQLSAFASNSHLPFTEHVYDPRDPTPHLGGPSFNWLNSGRVAQNELEIRDDVLTFTSQKLAETVLVVGQVSLCIHFWSDNQNTDVFVKLCDVDGKNGKSHNVMEKMTRLSSKDPWASDGTIALDIDMGPIAVEFRKGNSIRIQISGAAHPLYLRRNGDDDHLSMNLKPAFRKVFHSLQNPSRICLPIVQTAVENDKNL